MKRPPPEPSSVDECRSIVLRILPPHLDRAWPIKEDLS